MAGTIFRRGGGALRLIALALVASAATMVFPTVAAAATVGVTACSEVSVGYAVTFSGVDFAPNAVVTAYDGGALRGTTTSDQRGAFNAFAILVVSLPSEVTFVDASGQAASMTVSTCGGGEGDAVGAPLVPDDCRLERYASFSGPAFANQGQCVSAVSSKSK